MRKTRKKLIYILLVLAVCAFTYLGYNLNNKELDSEETFQDNISEVNLVQNEENTEIVESKETTDVSTVDSKNTNELTEFYQAIDSEISESITSKKLMKSNTYFIEGKLERDKKRSEMISSLNDIINNENTNEAIRDQAINMKLNIIANSEKEVFIENMIMAKGFNDVIVYLSDQSINIVVNSENLTEKDVAKIVDIVKRETDIAIDNIIIMGKK